MPSCHASRARCCAAVSAPPSSAPPAPQACWGASEQCATTTLCPYRWVFETPHPPDIAHLHNLRDVPRPFVIEPPLDDRTHHAAGDVLAFHLVLIGRGADYLPYFLFAFEQLGHMGLGKQRARARLERVSALTAWRPTGHVVYQDGRVLPDAERLPLLDADAITVRAHRLPADLRLTLPTPLRVKHGGEWLRAVDPAALVQAICWRLNALSVFHGGGPWDVDHRALVAQAREIAVEHRQCSGSIGGAHRGAVGGSSTWCSADWGAAGGCVAWGRRCARCCWPAAWCMSARRASLGTGECALKRDEEGKRCTVSLQAHARCA